MNIKAILAGVAVAVLCIAGPAFAAEQVNLNTATLEELSASPVCGPELAAKIVEYREKTDSTVIMISHSMEDMAVYCDKILVMSDSKPYMYGAPAEVFGRATELEAVGLSVPQVTKMMLALKEKGFDVRTDIYTVAQAKDEIERLLQTV